MRRIPALDGLRGVAILAVVLCHTYNLQGGFYGVDLFFVLSGFLITSLLLEEREKSGRVSLRAFYIRRVRRLGPAAVVVALLMLPLMGWKLTVEAALYASNFVRAFAHPDPLVSKPLDHFWSLAAEEQFYLLWPPILVVLLARGRGRRIGYALLGLFALLVVYRGALAAGGASSHRLYFAPDTHADGLVLGCALAFLRRPVNTVLAAVAAAVAAVLIVLGQVSRPWEVFGQPAFELSAAVLVLAAVTPGPPARLLSFRPLVWLGLISYSLYLWHRPTLSISSNPTGALVLALMFAILSYRFIERPFRKFGRQRIRIEERTALDSFIAEPAAEAFGH